MPETPEDLTQVSIVILSEGNNPRILNPDFLARNGIVPNSWEPAEVLVLPPLASVKYKNGIQLTVEVEKVQVITSSPTEINWAEDLPRMAVSFMSTLPQVQYGSVGLNFAVIQPVADIQDIQAELTNTLLKDGDWMEFGSPARLGEMKLQYHIEETDFNIVITFVSKKEQQQEIKGVHFSANFHKNFTPDDDDMRREYLYTLPRKHDIFLELISRIPVAER